MSIIVYSRTKLFLLRKIYVTHYVQGFPPHLPVPSMIHTFSGIESVLAKCKLSMVSIIGVLASKTHSVISYADICPWTMWVTQSSSWRGTALLSAELCFVLLLVCWFVFWHSYQRCYFIYFHPQLFPKHTHTINIHENDQKSML